MEMATEQSPSQQELYQDLDSLFTVAWGLFSFFVVLIYIMGPLGSLFATYPEPPVIIGSALGVVVLLTVPIMSMRWFLLHVTFKTDVFYWSSSSSAKYSDDPLERVHLMYAEGELTDEEMERRVGRVVEREFDTS